MGSLDDSTCFVRNVPPSVDEDQLTACFAEVGPVRKAFLVRTRGLDVHKGIAFVTFAVPDDASKAVRELNAHKLDGKPLHVCSVVPVLVLFK
jgi:RNA recognition motif-containing protein